MYLSYETVMILSMEIIIIFFSTESMWLSQKYHSKYFHDYLQKPLKLVANCSDKIWFCQSWFFLRNLMVSRVFWLLPSPALWRITKNYISNKTNLFKNRYNLGVNIISIRAKWHLLRFQFIDILLAFFKLKQSQMKHSIY